MKLKRVHKMKPTLLLRHNKEHTQILTKQKMMKKTITTIIFIFSSLIILSAQKFGYVNSAELISNLAEVKTADTELESYQKELFTKGEQMVKAFETEYNAYMTKVNAGQLSQIQMQT